MKNSTKGIIGVVIIVLVIAGALIFSNANLFKGSMRGFNPTRNVNVNPTTTISSEFKTKCQSVVGENACWQESPMTCWMHGGGCGSGASYTTLAALNAGIARMEAVRAEFKTKCQSVVGENACWQESPMTCWMRGGGCGSGASYTTLAALNAEIARMALPDKPTASFEYPTAADSELQPNTVNIVAIASDNVRVTKVEFIVDHKVIHTWDSPSADGKYRYAWDTLSSIAFSRNMSDMFHILGVVSYDAAGNKSDESTIRVKVKGRPYSDLIISSVTPSPATPTRNVQFTLVNAIKNQGAGASMPQQMRCTGGNQEDIMNLRNGAVSVDYYVDMPVIMPGETYTKRQTAIIPVAGSVGLDCNTQGLGESNSDNNHTSSRFNVN